mmetsp:Transcript_2225/g.6637  ORF Transcript_2225/g.6637 Transcript_2225/m.6637 type:complete len:81 (-) Transcript_2225:755-997(-)
MFHLFRLLYPELVSTERKETHFWEHDDFEGGLGRYAAKFGPRKSIDQVAIDGTPYAGYSRVPVRMARSLDVPRVRFIINF